MKRQVGEFTIALNKAISDPADQAGKLEQYQSAMKQYHDAMRLRAWGQGLKEAATSTVAKAAAGAGAGAVGPIWSRMR